VLAVTAYSSFMLGISCVHREVGYGSAVLDAYAGEVDAGGGEVTLILGLCVRSHMTCRLEAPAARPRSNSGPRIRCVGSHVR
jgi:hypothetical protein